MIQVASILSHFKNQIRAMKTKRNLFQLCLLCAVLFSALTSGATTLTVTNVADSGPGTLRQLITTAPVGATINFTANLSGATITLTNGELVLTNDVTIDATALPGGIRIDGNQMSRIFHERFLNSVAIVTLNGLTLTNAIAPISSLGGAIFLEAGTMTLNQCTLIGNFGYAAGGAICNYFSTLTVNQCTITGNYCQNRGGGIYNEVGILVVNQSTVSSNNAGLVGGIYNYQGSMKLTNSIVAANAAFNGPADLITDVTPLTFGGSNIVQHYYQTNGGTYLGSTPINTNPQLAPLDNYGGPTPTMLPTAGSPAIDAGADLATNFFATDQRGFPRRSGLHVDIGATESAVGTYIVTTNADSGSGSLRQWISIVVPGSTIVFASNLSGGIITLTNGQLVLTNSITIDASALPGGIEISGNLLSRIFYVTNNAAVTMDVLTLVNGVTSGVDNGAGILIVSGTLTLNQCSLFSNNSSNEGGGICANQSGLVTLNGCTLAGNIATGGAAAILCSFTPMVLNQCTVEGNIQTAPGGGGGGAINNMDSTMTIIQSTITANSTPAIGGSAGGVFNFGILQLTNSIVAGNSSGTPASQDIVSVKGGGSNEGIISMGGTNIVQSYQQLSGATFSGTIPLNAAPQLAPLDNYGGLTLTMPPLPGSPAVNAGSDITTNLFVTDQRGLPRVFGPHIDIGAVESVPVSGLVTNATDDGLGSLRQVILFATNGLAITFAANLSGTIVPVFRQAMVINTNLTIDASALPNGIEYFGGGNFRLFDVANGAHVTMTALTIANGNGGQQDSFGLGGGGIFNVGILTLNRCTLMGNNANFINTGNTTGGGGVFSSGSLFVNECTFTANHADFGAGGGGAIFSTGNLTVDQSTLSGNSADNGNGGGGGIYNSGNLTINNSIVSGNTANGSPGGADVLNTSFSASLNGANLIQDFNGSYSGFTPDMTPPLLSTVGNYGGPTPTMPPRYGSPAIDKIFGLSDFTTDQRGFPRRIQIPDIGSVEYNGSTLVTNNLDNGAGTLRDAIFHSTNGSTITFAANMTGQTISLISGELLFNQNLNIDGSSLTNGVIIKATLGSRVFDVSGNLSTNVLTALTITNGTRTIGGGVYNNGGNLTLNRCSLLGNLAGAGGGGAFFNAGTAAINECTFTGNSVTRNQLVQWTFETSQPITAGQFNPEIGTGSALGHHAGTTTYNDPVGNGSQTSFSSSGWAIGDYYQFSVSTNLPGGLIVSWDQISSSTGPRDFNFFYSTNGVDFTQFGSTYMVSNNVAPNIWSVSVTNSTTRCTNDLSGIAALNNAPTVYIRLVCASTVSANGGTVGSTGTDRIDNFTVNSADGGGAIGSSGTLAVNQSTLTGNNGGGISSSGTLAVNNSIVVSNNLDGVLGTFTGVSNFLSGNPILAPLGNYGGPTPTMPPMSNSPAIDAGSDLAASIFTIDQRGLQRLSGPHVDIGAAEYQYVIATNPPSLGGFINNGSKLFRLTFTNITAVSFTVFASTNMMLPISQWSNLGPVTESPAGSGNYLFTDLQSSNIAQRFFIIRSP